MTSSDGSAGDAGPLSPDRWAHVRALVEEARTIPPEARPAFLDASCGGDAALRDRVARLAAACDRAGDSWAFLAQPPSELVAQLLVAHGTPTAGLAARADGPPTAFRAALADRYAVGAELGRGGMATVYVAEDLRHRRRVAVKVLHPELGAALGAERFLREIAVTAALQHPHILPLHDSGEAAGTLYYVMPYVEGESLRDRLARERQLPVEDAVRVACDVASALDYAHRQGAVHRDVKPENVLLHDWRALVADFGIARAAPRLPGRASQSGDTRRASTVRRAASPVTILVTDLGSSRSARSSVSRSHGDQTPATRSPRQRRPRSRARSAPSASSATMSRFARGDPSIMANRVPSGDTS